MRAKLLIETLKTLYRNKRAVCIEGAPGGGKTTITQQVAKELGVGYIEKHMPTMLVEDFGILYPNGDNMLHYKLPDWFPAADRTDIPEEGILCFDDRNQASNDLQKVLANIMQARTLHGTPIKEGWRVISTGNRQSDRAGANRVLSHVRGRETVIELETHIDDFTSWAISNNVKPVIISFVRFRPQLLHDFDPQRDQNPSPRSWVEGVSDAIGTVPYEAEYEVFKGAVGEGAASEFVGFLRIERKLPNIESIIKSPTTVDVPDDPATCYALTGALGNRATVDNFANIVKYAERMKPEFSDLCVSYASKKNEELASTEAFTQWAINHQDVLF